LIVTDKKTIILHCYSLSFKLSVTTGRRYISTVRHFSVLFKITLNARCLLGKNKVFFGISAPLVFSNLAMLISLRLCGLSLIRRTRKEGVGPMTYNRMKNEHQINLVYSARIRRNGPGVYKQDVVNSPFMARGSYVSL
jgi:hypothetical protein